MTRRNQHWPTLRSITLPTKELDLALRCGLHNCVSEKHFNLVVLEKGEQPHTIWKRSMEIYLTTIVDLSSSLVSPWPFWTKGSLTFKKPEVCSQSTSLILCFPPGQGVKWTHKVVITVLLNPNVLTKRRRQIWVTCFSRAIMLLTI